MRGLIPFPHPFSYSHKINVGVLHARGDYLLLLNDDVEVLPEGWRDTLAACSKVRRRGSKQC